MTHAILDTINILSEYYPHTINILSDYRMYTTDIPSFVGFTMYVLLHINSF